MRKIHSLCTLSLFVAAAWWAQIASAQMISAINGTWFGNIVLTAPGGKQNHDTAVLVVSENGTTNGGMGRSIDQMTSWTDGSVQAHELTFHLDAAGGPDVALKKALCMPHLHVQNYGQQYHQLQLFTAATR